MGGLRYREARRGVRGDCGGSQATSGALPLFSLSALALASASVAASSSSRRKAGSSPPQLSSAGSASACEACEEAG